MAQEVKRNLPHFDIRIVAVHPKRPNPEQLDAYNIGVEWADIIDYQYWKSAVMLLDNFPNNKPKTLTHHNPYNLHESNWKQFNSVIVNNQTMNKDLKGSLLIPNAIDLDFFQFQREMPGINYEVIMVSSRIESKKGVLPVAEACKELGYKMHLIGSISDRDYFDKIMSTGVVKFSENITDMELLDAYKDSAIHVCNSVDGYESGTNPILEAMAVGVPVITRNIGHVPELNNGENMIVRKGQPEDIEELKQEIKKLYEDVKKRMSIRENAWKTVKVRDSLRRAISYEKLYWEILKPCNELVSVIIPTFNRKEILAETIKSILAQDWPAVEIIICDDGSNDGTRELILKLRSILSDKIITPIKYVNTNKAETYNLAEARNLGIIESVGEILILLDDRYYAEPNLISEFISKLKEKHWLYGNKGSKKSFIENVSCIYRQDLINAGMFNQSCNKYGFQSQELRSRFQKQGFKLDFCESAKVKTQFDTKNKYSKKDQIKDAKNILWRLNLE